MRADTIFALASAAGRAGVAVMRVSGPGAGAALEALAGPLPGPRAATLRRLSGAGGETFDDALVLWFPAPASFTGEDVAELHLHGGRAVLDAAADALLAAGCRPAEPGEFSRRAFENGKLDLAQVEAVADLVDAETAGQRAQALAQLDGALSRFYDDLRDRLVEALALVEAEIDFPDEDDVPGGVAAKAGPIVSRLIADLDAELADDHRGERIREGFHVALIGAPNAGKSTLLNRLARRDAAIVTDVPGTTRDVVEVRLALGGHLVVLADTAGLREVEDEVEREGVRRARARAETADLRIAVVDAADPHDAAALAATLRDGDLVWINKTDAAGPDAAQAAGASFHVKRLSGSAKTGDGIAALEDAVAARVAADLAPRETPSLSRARHRHAAARALEALRRAEARFADAPELAGEDLRLAARALGEIAGRVDVEHVLDKIFADFCIGK